MNTYDPQTPPSDFIDGFAAGAELSRQAAFEAWQRYSYGAFSGLTGHNPEYLRLRRSIDENQGFDNGVRLGRLYANKPAEPKPMTAEQHNKYPKGRWT